MNTYAQFVLDAYASTTYVSSYITKFDRNMTTAFKKIKDECLANNDGKIQTIRKFGNTLLNMQQMSLVHVDIFPTKNRCYCNTCALL